MPEESVESGKKDAEPGLKGVRSLGERLQGLGRLALSIVWRCTDHKITILSVVLRCTLSAHCLVTHWRSSWENIGFIAASRGCKQSLSSDQCDARSAEADPRNESATRTCLNRDSSTEIEQCSQQAFASGTNKD